MSVINKSVFDVCSLDRSKVHWEDYLQTFTPVQLVKNDETGQSMLFKREDCFAPLGYGGINGAKLRQAIWLMNEHLKCGGHPDLFSASVVGSPQLIMGALVSRHYGGVTRSVLGVTTPEKCLKHAMVAGATWAGTQWDFIGSGFNSALQPHCRKLMAKYNPDGFFMEYGITLDHEVEEPSRISAFHVVGGHQAANIPDEVDTIVLPFGSANSATSFFTGLAMYPKPNLKKIILIGIGPNKIKWIEHRLSIIGKELDLPNILAWSKNYIHNKELENPETVKPKTRKLFGNTIENKSSKVYPLYEVEHHDLHTTGWVAYSDLMDYQWGDIELHPRYEGKVMSYIQKVMPEVIKPTTLFWIVGGYPRVEDMKVSVPELGDIPSEVQTINLD